MPWSEIISRFNWVDIVVVCTVLATTSSGLRGGFIVGIFRTIGIAISTFVAIHYFSGMADFLMERVPNFGIYFADPLSFLFLFTLSYLLVFLVRLGLCFLLKVEAANNALNRWGGFALGAVRGILISSLLVIFMNVSFINYLQRSVRKSYFNKRAAYVDLNIYEFLFNKVFSKFSPGKKLNKNVYDIIENERVEEKTEVDNEAE